jgi:2-polyprenyl-3-methyl-5-hydroxy-6-metoxy-1,4-benzoquinol methylase
MKSGWKDWHAKKEGVVEPEVEKLEKLFKENNAVRILDVGCGAGRHTSYYAKKGFEVYGFDKDEEAIETDKQILRREGLKADLRVWDMTKPMPYQDELFDAALAVRVIHHTSISNITKIVHELDRVLKPKGFLFLQVPSYESGTFDSGTIWAEPGTLIARGGPEKDVPHHFFKRDELLDMFPGYATREIHSDSDHYGDYCLIIQKRERVQSSRNPL